MFLRRTSGLLLIIMLVSGAWAAPVKPPNFDFEGELSDVVTETSNLVENATFYEIFTIGPCSLQAIGNDFVGTFYDFKRDRAGRDIPMDSFKFTDRVEKFMYNGWDTAKFARYYRSPKKLYTISFMIPPVLSALAPANVFLNLDAVGYCWLMHYEGPLVHMNGITFRFRGMGDDFLVVRVDGKIVFSACAPGIDTIANAWDSSSAESRKYYMGHNLAEVGDWITLEPGVSLDMEVIMGEVSGDVFSAMLAVEVQGVEYPTGPQGNPILPMFKTAVPWKNLIEEIHADLVPGEICVTNGPIFCDYDTGYQSPELDFDPVESPVFAEPAQSPKFNIEFHVKKSEKLSKESSFTSGDLPKYLDYTFAVKLKQVSGNEYNHELKVDFFAIGEEIDGDNYILLDHQDGCFTPSEENGRSYEFKGEAVPVYEKTIPEEDGIFGQRRGDKYSGYLVVVADENGMIVDYDTSHKWLIDVLGNLRRLSVGRHFDKAGARVEPPRLDPIGVY